MNTPYPRLTFDFSGLLAGRDFLFELVLLIAISRRPAGSFVPVCMVFLDLDLCLSAMVFCFMVNSWTFAAWYIIDDLIDASRIRNGCLLLWNSLAFLTLLIVPLIAYGIVEKSDQYN